MLTGVENFRDFGGYRTTTGLQVPTGRLFRSAHLARATPDDLARLQPLGLTLIVDLRRPGERRHHRTGDWATSCLTISSDIGGDDDPWIDFVRAGDLSPPSFSRHMVAFYREAPFEARHVDLFARYFTALAALSGGALVHCAAGKDRTGLLVALTHDLLDVHRDDAMEDYLATNRQRSYETHGQVVWRRLEELTGKPPGEAAVRSAMAVEAAYLTAAFAAIEERCGTVDAYFRDVLGVTPAMTAAIRSRFTVAPPA